MIVELVTLGVWNLYSHFMRTYIATFTMFDFDLFDSQLLTIVMVTSHLPTVHDWIVVRHIGELDAIQNTYALFFLKLYCF